MPIVNRVADLHGEITGWRRDLHMHPELMYDVQRTALVGVIGAAQAVALVLLVTVLARRPRGPEWSSPTTN